MAIRNITFPKAFCTDLNEIINIYQVKENFFDETSKHHSLKYKYHCPDNNCKVKMTPINTYSIIKPKHALHFRTIGSHINCKYQTILNNPQITYQDKIKNINQMLNFHIPNKFILPIPKSSNQKDITPSLISTSHEGAYSSVTKNLINNINQKDTNINTTSDLELLVDLYGSPFLTKKYIRDNDIRLTLPDGKSRFFDNCFKYIRFFKNDNAPFIFYDKIESIKPYGNNFKLVLKTYIDDGEANRKISIYVSIKLIEEYRFKNRFLAHVNKIMQSNNITDTTVFFTGAYPELFEYTSGKMTYQINLQSLSHLILVNNNL